MLGCRLEPGWPAHRVSSVLSGQFYVYDTVTGRLIAEHLSAHASSVSALAFAGDGVKLGTADSQGTVKVWADARKLNSKSTALLTLKGHNGAITSAGFSSDRQRFVTTSADKTARVWDLANAGAQSGHWKSPAFPKSHGFPPMDY